LPPSFTPAAHAHDTHAHAHAALMAKPSQSAKPGAASRGRSCRTRRFGPNWPAEALRRPMTKTSLTRRCSAGSRPRSSAIVARGRSSLLPHSGLAMHGAAQSRGSSAVGGLPDEPVSPPPNLTMCPFGRQHRQPLMTRPAPVPAKERASPKTTAQKTPRTPPEAAKKPAPARHHPTATRNCRAGCPHPRCR
jgi:hypothetical protein